MDGASIAIVLFLGLLVLFWWVRDIWRFIKKD